MDIVDTSPSEMMLASVEPETLLARCVPVLRLAQQTGSLASFVLEVFFVCVVGGGCRGRVSGWGERAARPNFLIRRPLCLQDFLPAQVLPRCGADLRDRCQLHPGADRGV